MSMGDQVFGVGAAAAAASTASCRAAEAAAGRARSASGRKKRGPKGKPPTERAVRGAKAVQRVERSYSSQKRDQVLVFMEQQRVHDPGSRSAGADGYRRPYSREAAEYFKIPMSTIHTWWQLRRKKMAEEADKGCEGSATPVTGASFLPRAPTTSWAPVPHAYSPGPTAYSPAYNGAAPTSYPPAPDAYTAPPDPYGPPPSVAVTTPSAYSPAPAYAPAPHAYGPPAHPAPPCTAGDAPPAWCFEPEARQTGLAGDYSSAFAAAADSHDAPSFAAPDYAAYAALPTKPETLGVKREDSPMFDFENNADGHGAAGGVDVKPSIIGTSA